MKKSASISPLANLPAGGEERHGRNGLPQLQRSPSARSNGQVRKTRADGTLSTSNAALLLLTYMASITYDWDVEHNCPTADVKAKGYPCRYYKRGAEAFAFDYGKLGISPEQAMSEESQDYIEKRKGAARQEFKRSINTLKEWGVVKQLEHAKNGLPAGFLLLLGDDEENRAVERWARQCLNLPMVW